MFSMLCMLLTSIYLTAYNTYAGFQNLSNYGHLQLFFYQFTCSLVRGRLHDKYS